MKKRIMVHYKLVPTDEYNLNYSGRCWCLKLTRYRIIGFIVVVFLAMSMVALAHLKTTVWTSKNFINESCINLTSQLEGSAMKHSSKKASKFNSPFYKQRLPTVLIIGARKAGTRALLQFVSLHKSVAAAKRETHFFDRHYDEGFEWYRNFMPYSLPHQITIEKTPNYFVDADVPERVHKYNASIKMLLIVRNPIDRAMSDYIQLKENNMKATGQLLAPFEELVINQETGEINKSYSPLKRSLYCRHIEKWLAYFPLSQILILDGENIKFRPWEEIAKVEKFLGLPETIEKSRFIFNGTKGFFCVKTKVHNSSSIVADGKKYFIDPVSKLMYFERCLAKSKGREHPAIQPDVRTKLKEFFKPFNERFFMRVNQYFNWR